MLTVFFFFQAEDGIRDLTVTGVQTCALPISNGLISGEQRSCGGGFCSQAHRGLGEGIANGDVMPGETGKLPKRLRSEEHTSELQSQSKIVCRLLLEKKKKIYIRHAC